jgi:hypothetical protein
LNVERTFRIKALIKFTAIIIFIGFINFLIINFFLANVWNKEGLGANFSMFLAKDVMSACYKNSV